MTTNLRLACLIVLSLLGADVAGAQERTGIHLSPANAGYLSAKARRGDRNGTGNGSAALRDGGKPIRTRGRRSRRTSPGATRAVLG